MNSKSILANGAVKTVAVILSVGLVMAGALYFTTKSKARSSENEFNPAFKSYLSAYTGGVISREAPVIIKFISEVANPDQINVPIEKDLFKFSPSVKG